MVESQTIEVIMPDEKDNVIITITGQQPSITALRSFILEQYPKSLGAQYTSEWL